MLNYKNTQFSTSTDVSYHDDSYVFNEEKGFQLAFGIIDINYDDPEEYIDVKAYQRNLITNGVEV